MFPHCVRRASHVDALTNGWENCTPSQGRHVGAVPVQGLKFKAIVYKLQTPNYNVKGAAHGGKNFVRQARL